MLNGHAADADLDAEMVLQDAASLIRMAAPEDLEADVIEALVPVAALIPAHLPLERVVGAIAEALGAHGFLNVAGRAIAARALGHIETRRPYPPDEGAIIRPDEWPRRANGAEPPLVMRRASDITPEQVRWLWPGRFPLGKLSLIGGHPGLGKSQISAQLAAVTTTGRNWPDGASCEYTGGAAILSAEDDPADTIVPRLIAAGADLGSVHIVDAVRDDEGVRPVDLRQDIEPINWLLSEHDVRLVVIDPITAYLGATDSHKNAEIRALLSPLSEMAARHGAAIVAVTHFNKGGGGEATLRFMGSLAFAAAARAAWAVVREEREDDEEQDEDAPPEPRRCLFLPAKNNLACDLGGLAYTVEGATIKDDIETSRIRWADGAVNMSADDALNTGERDAGEGDALSEAKAFLRATLECRPVPANEVLDRTDKAGIKEKTLRRAKAKLGVDSKKLGADVWVWVMPQTEDGQKGARDSDDGHLGHVQENQRSSQPEDGQGRQDGHVQKDEGFQRSDGEGGQDGHGDGDAGRLHPWECEM